MNYSFRKQITYIPALTVLILTILGAGFNAVRSIGTQTYRLPITSPEEDIVYAFRRDLTSISYKTGEEDFIDIELRPSAIPNSWTGWGVDIFKDIPEEAVISIDWEISENIPETIMNIVEKPDNSRSDGQGERWYTQISARSGRYKKYILFSQFLHNDFQAEQVQVDGELSTEAPFRIEFSLNPALHTQEVRFRVYDISFLWKEHRLPLLIFSLGLAATAVLLLLRRKPFLPKDSTAIYLTLAGVAILAVSFSTVDVIADTWIVAAVPLSVLLFTFLYFKFDISIFLFHFTLYPFLFAAVIPYADSYRYLILSLLLLLPILKNSWWQSIFSTAVFSAYIVFLYFSELVYNPCSLHCCGICSNSLFCRPVHHSRSGFNRTTQDGLHPLQEHSESYTGSHTHHRYTEQSDRV